MIGGIYQPSLHLSHWHLARLAYLSQRYALGLGRGGCSRQLAKGLLLSQIQKNPYAARLDIGLRRRTLAMLLTLLAALAMLALLLSFGPKLEPRGEASPISVVTIAAPQAESSAPEAATTPPETSPAPTPEPQSPQPEMPQPPSPSPAPPQALPPPSLLPPMNPAPATPPASAPPARPAQVYGPPDRRSRSSQDTPRVGTAPNGEPMYAASWYREPTDAELRGYLSTASSPAWGLIACRTAPDFRVEDCVALEEYPQGSQMNRAILAAAWQFRVRPPRLGGRVMVGSWVRIRIDYNIGRI